MRRLVVAIILTVSAGLSVGVHASGPASERGPRVSELAASSPIEATATTVATPPTEAPPVTTVPPPPTTAAAPPPTVPAPVAAPSICARKEPLYADPDLVNTPGRDVLARESGGDYHAISPDCLYFGAWQFLRSTWDSTARASDRPWLAGVVPSDASPADQDYIAAVLWHDGRGCSHWGACGR